MSYDWNKIGEEISSLYEKMEYRPDYGIEKFESDFIIEKQKERVSISRNPNTEFQNSAEWISVLRNVFEHRRSILTKLFSFTNNPNGVDILIEYCDYYKSYYDVETLRNNNIPVVALSTLQRMFHTVFMTMAKNEITKQVIEYVWEFIYSDTGIRSVFPDRLPAPGFVAMVIMADSDLNAAVLALERSRHTYFEVSRVLVQEPIKEQLLNTMRHYGCEVDILSNYFYVFHNIAEALGNLNSENEFEAVSIWSENIIAAKKFSANAEIDTIWINAHGVLGAGLNSMIHGSTLFSKPLKNYWNLHSEVNNEIQITPREISKTYDLFYGGKWHSPANGKYWINQLGVSFAEAIETDANNCAKAAHGAFKIWRSKKWSQRAKIIRSFAERLRANGESDYADIVLQLVNHSLQYGTSVSIVRDGEAEIITTPKPVGVVAIASNDLKILFAKLTIASVTGNAVIALLNSRSSVSLAPYCDLIGTCGFPPGVISCLFTSDPMNYQLNEKLIDAVLSEDSETPVSEHDKFYQDKTRENVLYEKFFTSVTKPKSIWLQCA